MKWRILGVCITTISGGIVGGLVGFLTGEVRYGNIGILIGGVLGIAIGAFIIGASIVNEQRKVLEGDEKKIYKI